MSDPSDSPPMVLTFMLDDEVFGVDVSVVEEIVDPLPTTRAPNADPFAPALVNVRGSIVPVIDIRHRFGMGPAERLGTTRMLVLNVTVEGEPTRLALVADDVDAIIEIAETEPVPELGLRWPTQFFRGIARKDGQVVIILNSETAFPPRLPADLKAA